MKGHLIEKGELVCRPKQITNAVLNPLVDVHLVRNYFTTEAWKLVENVVAVKRNLTAWVCKVCNSTGASTVLCVMLAWSTHFNVRWPDNCS